MDVKAYKESKDEAEMLKALYRVDMDSLGPYSTHAYYSDVIEKAAQLGHALVLELALERGGDPHGTAAAQGATLRFDKAKMKGGPEVATQWARLIDPGSVELSSESRDKNGVVCHQLDGSPAPLFRACSVNSPGAHACARLLLEAGADPNCGGNALAPLLMLTQGGPQSGRHPSQQAGEAELCDLLCAAGADVNATEPMQGCSVVFFAAQKGLDHVVKTCAERGADLELANKGRTNPLMVAAAVCGLPDNANGGGTEDTVRLLVRLGAKLEPPQAVELERTTGLATLPASSLRRFGKHALANLVDFVVAGGGDAASPNSRATPGALATRERLVEEFERADARFEKGDRVVVSGLKGKPKYNGASGTVRGRCSAKARYPVAVDMRDGPEIISLKVANLALASET